MDNTQDLGTELNKDKVIITGLPSGLAEKNVIDSLIQLNLPLSVKVVDKGVGPYSTSEIFCEGLRLATVHGRADSDYIRFTEYEFHKGTLAHILQHYPIRSTENTL